MFLFECHIYYCLINAKLTVSCSRNLNFTKECISVGYISTSIFGDSVISILGMEVIFVPLCHRSYK